MQKYRSAYHNDKFIELTTGRIVGAAEHQLVGKGGDHSGYDSYAVYSDDNGYHRYIRGSAT